MLTHITPTSLQIGLDYVHCDKTRVIQSSVYDKAGRWLVQGQAITGNRVIAQFNRKFRTRRERSEWLAGIDPAERLS